MGCRGDSGIAWGKNSKDAAKRAIHELPLRVLGESVGKAADLEIPATGCCRDVPLERLGLETPQRGVSTTDQELPPRAFAGGTHIAVLTTCADATREAGETKGVVGAIQESLKSRFFEELIRGRGESRFLALLGMTCERARNDMLGLGMTANELRMTGKQGQRHSVLFWVLQMRKAPDRSKTRLRSFGKNRIVFGCEPCAPAHSPHGGLRVFLGLPASAAAYSHDCPYGDHKDRHQHQGMDESSGRGLCHRRYGIA
jgi:hypothetical protein